MTLVTTRAALEKAVTDSVTGADSSVKVFYDNTAHAVPGKNTKYVEITIDVCRTTLQGHGESLAFHRGVVSCNVYIPRSAGSAVLSAISQSVIDGLTSVNASNYTDTYNCTPRVEDIVGPSTIDLPDSAHYLGTISCQFTALA